MNLIKSLFTGAVLMAAAAVSLAEQPMPLPLGRDISASFTGTAHQNDLVMPETMGGVPQTNVITFEPGSRSGWHTHGAMTVIGIAGVGLYQAWGKPAVLVRPGDVIHIPAGVSHWHGATKNSRFQQFVVYDKTWKAPAGLEAHKGKITDAEYDALKPVDAANRASEPKDGFLFAHPKKTEASDHYTRPIQEATLLPKENAAKSPEWTYLVFPHGAYSAWHSHKSGEVLIATDGIGLNQAEGGKLEVLLPGDVVYTKPGVSHWVGSAPWSSFAGIVIHPGSDTAVTWKGFPDAYGPLANGKGDPAE